MHTATLDSSARNRRAMIAFLPLLLLISAAVVTNLGGGMTGKAHAANSVTVTSNVGSDVHITSTCGTAGTDGTLAFGSVNAATPYDNNAAPCAIIYGSTQASTNLQLSGATNLGWAGFSAGGTTACAAAAAGQIGIRADATSTAVPQAPYNCADGQIRQIPTSAATICQSPAGVDTRCDLVVGFHTGAVAAGAKTGVLTTTLA